MIVIFLVGIVWYSLSSCYCSQGFFHYYTCNMYMYVYISFSHVLQVFSFGSVCQPSCLSHQKCLSHVRCFRLDWSVFSWCRWSSAGKSISSQLVLFNFNGLNTHIFLIIISGSERSQHELWGDCQAVSHSKPLSTQRLLQFVYWGLGS